MPPHRAVGPRILLTVEQKIELIEAQEREQLSVRELAKRYNIGKTQASKIIQNKEEIRLELKSGKMHRTQKRRNPLSQQGSHIDELCFEWFTMTRSDGMPLNGEIVREKARELAEQAGYSGFTASAGWLQKWQKRHNISYNPMDDSLVMQPFEAVLVKSEPILPDDDCSASSVIRPIFTIDEAMMQLSRLKEFAKDDYISYQQLHSLENQWSWKWNNMKKEVP
ncbi:uncharacterized protein Dana_GF13390 [Drosophila ananassae]|uniref:HTH CENPB-type domain-containing protein n=1 Tax=Drosophila ananassae TaxID=7217 RepID=B3MCS5_DROAN|nr:tigger transposable element-derived protein 3 [Drosophila ananassae]EDV37327.1 uncharacterized protein Dana_GF13390 [Drosophila ananassae]